MKKKDEIILCKSRIKKAIHLAGIPVYLFLYNKYWNKM